MISAPRDSIFYVVHYVEHTPTLVEAVALSFTGRVHLQRRRKFIKIESQCRKKERFNKIKIFLARAFKNYITYYK